MQYKCLICGYVYDDAKESIPFAQLPDSWTCPICGAPKSAFEPVDSPNDVVASNSAVSENGSSSSSSSSLNSSVQSSSPEAAGSEPDMQKLSTGQMAALCSNLARGCEKQYMSKEQALFLELADYFTRHAPKVEDATVASVSAQLQQDLSDYQTVMQTAKDNSDRGALRALTWGEKVTRMLTTLMERYQSEGDAMLADNDIWICSVCGFVYIGKTAPELCPVCKVPAWKFDKIERRK